ncbi:hypothetical protein K458DRAFT_451634 [Lentithecium fluviatile CBS 122367]|uniref:Uncharacterized protein n=1 Tax=Lentithecium fluviatile CBS 122367 TaxID=1168545 RepID=A0A6G1J147_9PLEO|nr:hypothetical protein K458DRAFT_451634 [Lentithecium fluviatile CBS 122367]
MGQSRIERDALHKAYESDLKRDLDAINNVLDRETEAEADPTRRTQQPLLRSCSAESIKDRGLVEMIHFAKDPYQRLLRWRVCNAHMTRLGGLDLRNPRKEFDNLVIEMNPICVNHVADGTTPLPADNAERNAIRASVIQRMLQATESPSRGATQSGSINERRQTPLPAHRLFEPTPKVLNSTTLPLAVCSPRQTYTRYVNPADYPSVRTSNTQKNYVWSQSSNSSTKSSPTPQATMSPKQGHMPNLTSNAGQKRKGADIDPDLFSTKRRATSGPVVSSFVHGYRSPYCPSGAQQAYGRPPSPSQEAGQRTASSQSQHKQPERTQPERQRQLTPATSSPTIHSSGGPILDLQTLFVKEKSGKTGETSAHPILDPNALYVKERDVQTGERPAMPQSLQQRQPPTQQPAPQQPRPLPTVQSSQAGPVSQDRANPEWVVWYNNQQKKAEEERQGAARLQRLRVEIQAEIAAGADVLAYRYYEYMKLFPINRQGDNFSKYHRDLLANQVIRERSSVELRRAVQFAKSRWWNYWTSKELDIVMEAMKKAEERPSGLAEDM